MQSPTRRIAALRAYARRYPRPYWVLLTGEAVQSIGFGLCVPYFALFLTTTADIPTGKAGLVMAVWAVTALVGAPLGGVLSDRVGRRPVMLLSLAGAGFAAASYGLVSGLAGAMVATFFWAIFNSAFEPAAAAYVSDVAPPELRTEAYGLWRVVNNGFFAVGPPLGALVIWLSSLRACFVLAGVGILLCLGILWRGLPESRPTPGGSEPPARFREALRDRLLVILALGTSVVALAFAFYEDVLPVFLHQERGLAIATWGLLFGINPVLIAAFQYPIARWAARRSSRLVLAVGATLVGGALTLLLPFEGLVAIAGAIVLLTFGEMLVAPVSSALAAELAPERLRGSYQGVLNLAWEGAWGPAALVGLWLVGRGQGELLLALGLPLGLLAALLYLALPGGRLQRQPGPVPVDPIHGGATRADLH